MSCVKPGIRAFPHRDLRGGDMEAFFRLVTPGWYQGYLYDPISREAGDTCLQLVQGAREDCTELAKSWGYDSVTFRDDP